MAWRKALQRQMYPVLARLLNQGCVLPLFVACIGQKGSMACGRYDDIEATGLDCIFEACHREADTFPRPLPLLIVDQRSAAAHVRLDSEDEEGHIHDTTETRVHTAPVHAGGVAGLAPVSHMGRDSVGMRSRPPELCGLLLRARGGTRR
jgi:hypothetical protein